MIETPSTLQSDERRTTNVRVRLWPPFQSPVAVEGNAATSVGFWSGRPVDLAFLRSEVEIMTMQTHELIAWTDLILSKHLVDLDVERDLLHLRARQETLLRLLEDMLSVAQRIVGVSSPQGGLRCLFTRTPSGAFASTWDWMMDNAVALVRAYLHLNGYFTVCEFPVLQATRNGGYHRRPGVSAFGFLMTLRKAQAIVGAAPAASTPQPRTASRTNLKESS